MSLGPTYSESAQAICDQAVYNGLRAWYRIPTLGDGNWFYRAVIDCYDYKYGSLPLGINMSHSILREKVCDYTHQHLNSSFVTAWENSLTGVEEFNHSMTTKINIQRQNGDFADELFIMSTARLLNIAIMCVDETNSPSNLYTNILAF